MNRISRLICECIGIAWMAFLLTAYFIPVTRESGANYVIKDTLLGVTIFHNIFLLIIYIALGLFFIWLGISHKIKMV
ncbi:hypothetical protein J4461_02925 [Candidatus Pacearchaeota archaeon]|nr:hypothetical protein [Candidatus Pacearchaeota archaeon]